MPDIWQKFTLKRIQLKPPFIGNRDLIRRTLERKGLAYLGELALLNCRDLARIIQWNQENSIRFFRVSSAIWPWMGTYDVAQLPQFVEIKAALSFAGDLARVYDQRITFHPSHFVKLGSSDMALTKKSSDELEGHSQVQTYEKHYFPLCHSCGSPTYTLLYGQVFDLMGFEPSPWNKINIHVGGVYGNKKETLLRWAKAYNQLSDACRARMTGNCHSYTTELCVLSLHLR